MTDLSGTRVLIVEDEALIALDLEDLCQQAGAEVVGVAMGNAEARSLLDSQAVDAVLLDFNLVDGDAVPTATRARELGAKIVFHSGQAAREALFERFPDSVVLPKPALGDVIVRSLARAVAGAPAR